ncbi:MAG: MFS transporter [Sedimentisphaerales bacterium]|nr:MFS transporter [Sedimentisphaerales bacterium]
MSYKKIQSRWNNVPFSPAKWPFFYGWVVVFASVIGAFASIPGQTIGVGVFTDFLIESLKLSRTQLSSAYMVGTIASSLLLPLAGSMLDRFGARLIGVLAAVGLGVSLLGLAHCDQLAELGSAGSTFFVFVVMVICFLAIRFFGQGMLGMVSQVMIGKWFNHHRGLASAILGVFIGFGFNAAPRFLNMLVNVFEWHGACLALAVIIGIGMSVFAWIFYRDNPEGCGLEMDGDHDEQWHRKMAERTAETVKEFTPWEAIKEPAFWVFSIAIGLQGLFMTAITFHITSLASEEGLSRSEAYWLFVPLAVTSVFATLAGGWASDRIGMKWLLVVMMIFQSLAAVGTLTISSAIGQIMFVGGYGISGGMFIPLLTVVCPRFFGREHLGAINGLNKSILVFMTAVGPVIYSSVRDWSGSYDTILCGAAIVPFIVLIAGIIEGENPQERF